MFTSIFPVTRWSLVRALDKQPERIGVLLALYAEAISHYLQRRLGSGPWMEDIIQEVLTYLLERPELLARAEAGEGSRFRYFLMQVCLNAARNARRREQRAQLPLQELLQAVSDQQPSAAEYGAMDRAWAQGLLQQAWQDLSRSVGAGDLDPLVPQLLRRSLLDGLSIRSIAQEFAIAPATCQRRIAQGRHHLQRSLRERLQAAGEAVHATTDVLSLLLQHMATAA